MGYPDYPSNRIIVDGVDLTTEFGLILMDGYKLSPPEPKTHTIKINGADGVLDLTEALTGDVQYSNRSQSFVMYSFNDNQFEDTKRKVSNFLHGKAFDYVLTFDPGYTYHGRFSITEYSHAMYAYPGIVGAISIDIDADPYKFKEKKVYKINAAGGVKISFSSGRKPVRPTIEVARETLVSFDGMETLLQAGTWRLNNVVFHEGDNVMYLNSYLGEGDVLIDDHDTDTIATYADTMISDLLWKTDKKVSMKISERGDDIIKPFKNDSILTTVYCESADEDYYVYVTYDWKDL